MPSYLWRKRGRACFPHRRDAAPVHDRLRVRAQMGRFSGGPVTEAWRRFTSWEEWRREQPRLRCYPARAEVDA